MNRIVFVGLCLIGMMVFALSHAEIKPEQKTENKIAKEHSKIVYS
ncbi:hypothetical protein ACFQ1Q_06675 [Winogradskyella litorisediminis]|uniref:Uncharacterized protein n=1 Tax=Winogradskyella litorisediminis TaxID=1156618 RepID=A0ABW3N622_9FLAO